MQGRWSFQAACPVSLCRQPQGFTVPSAPSLAPLCSSSPGPSALQSYPQKNDRDSYIKGLTSSQVALSDVQDRTILHSPSKIEANREIPRPAVHLKCYNPSLPPVGKHPPFQAPRPVPSYNLCYFGTPQPPENPVIKQPSTPLAFL